MSPPAATCKAQVLCHFYSHLFTLIISYVREAVRKYRRELEQQEAEEKVAA